MTESAWVEARESINAANHILILSHTRPDGDAIGSMLGLGEALKQAGKKVQCVLRDGLPSRFRFLPGSGSVQTKPEPGFDLMIVVDCGDLDRIGFEFEDYPIPDINFDHHISNTSFARINIVEPEEVAAAALLANNMEKLGLELTQDAAKAFLTGIITDTIGFRTQNMTPQTFTLAAKLTGMGLNISEIYDRALSGRSFNAARYWGKGLAKIQKDGGLVWTTLSISDREQVKYPGNDDADLVNVLSSIESSKIAVILIEQKNGMIKVSWRSKPGYDVSEVASSFGGGGHRAASGAMISGTLDDVQKAVLSATREIFDSLKN